MKKPGKRFSGAVLAGLALGFVILYVAAQPLYAFVFAFLYIALFVTGVYVSKGLGVDKKGFKEPQKENCVTPNQLQIAHLTSLLLQRDEIVDRLAEVNDQIKQFKREMA